MSKDTEESIDMGELNHMPKTYWEQRCHLNEKYMDNAIQIIGLHLPAIQQQITVLDMEYNDMVDKLEAQYNEG